MNNNQPPGRFCTNCGQPLDPSNAFCVSCGAQVGAPPMGMPDQPPVGTPPGYPPPYAQAPMQGQEDPLLSGLAAGYIANRARRLSLRRARRQRARRPGARLRGCGCLMLILIIIAGLYSAVTYTHGTSHLIITYVVGGMVVLLFLVAFIGMLMTRRGRDAVAEGLLEVLFDGLLGGGG